ncbi:diaminopimelate decarboxylase [Buchnera aphidicola (Ceratovacuna keduensis)]|uniref:diaminopimelate decarboxylase n=1 Tax=Buchnera aphidicola TaxID=9 RepID=UPI0031B8A79B
MKNDIYKKNILIAIKKIIKKYKEPFWIYEEKTILKQIKKLKKFDVIRYAQKSCSNINILKIMKENNLKIDAVSYGEINRAIQSGFSPKNNEIIFTSDIFEKKTLLKIKKLNITANIGSIDMIKQLGKISPGHKILLRINPKFGYGHSKKTNTGGENSKHGIWKINDAIKKVKKYKLKLLGFHIHVGSGVNSKNLKKMCKYMKKKVIKINKKINIISSGGGISIPYRKSEKKINIKKYVKKWIKTKKKIEKHIKKKIKLETEPGRFLVAKSGFLISEVRAIKKTSKYKFILLNVGFNDLIRPAMYGSYHKISVIKKNNKKIDLKKTEKVVISGPLCESGDIFTVKKNGDITTRNLPKISIGDFLLFHDVGAYGSSMSSNYNSRTLIKEFLLTKKNKIKTIRKKQKIKDLIKLEIIK